MDRRELELYLHIPFCIRKCAYCDFLSWAAAPGKQREYVEALKREIHSVGRELHSGIYQDQNLKRGKYQVTSVFFGGGTPSVLPGDWMKELMDEIGKVFDLKTEAEISVEANPGTLDLEKLTAYRQAGINRISLGCQSTNDKELALLGRIHTYNEFLESYELVRQAGFCNVNIDLMSGLPRQRVKDWEGSLEKIAALSPEHISAYSLIVEEGTPFASMDLELPSEEEERLMYQRTGEVLGGFGYQQYEISNYAKPGFSCRHNIGYWKRKPYLGLGLGAASLFEERRFSNTNSMKVYLNESGRPEHIRENIEQLGRKEQMEEFCFLGLRMIEGIDIKEFEQQFGSSFLEVYGPVAEHYKQLGMLQEREGHVALTSQGISVSNRIMSDFLLDEEP